MKLQTLVVGAIIFLAGCHNKSNTDKITTQTAKTATDGTQCYRLLTGMQNQDTTFIQLITNGSNVSGNMHWLPYQKDARIGTLKGTIQKDKIKGIWKFMQEGTPDSLEFAFKLDGANLYQMRYQVDRETGREILSDTAAFSIRYTKIDCPPRFK